METRILGEIRSIDMSSIEIRYTESHIYICGSLPIKSLSEPIIDRKTGKKFREQVLPTAFKLALLSNKAHGYKTKLLKNHSYDNEFEYDRLEFDEINERDFRFIFTLEKTKRNLELLEDVLEDDASFSFGFVCDSEKKVLSNEEGIDYIRIIYSFKELREISILDKFTVGAYRRAKGFKAYDYLTGEKKAKKFVLKNNRESFCEKQDEIIQEIKNYIAKQRRNSLFVYDSEFKIPL